MTRDELEPDFGLVEIAEAIGMSTRWVRDRCKPGGARHIRYGNKIRMTQAMVDELRAEHTKMPATESITTGQKKSTS